MNGREYTHPDVFTVGVAEGWAEAETDPVRIDWAARQARAAIPFQVADGRPVNPCEKTGITRGRNEMGFWGEQKMADALVTCTYHGTRYLLMIERADGYGWAVPGGHVEPGETGLQAAVRELAEETGLDARGWPFTVFREMPPRYVPDPRSSDEAWAVTVPVHIDLGDCDPFPAVSGADDAIRAGWIRADDYDQLRTDLADHFGGRVFAAHTDMLAEFLGSTAASLDHARDQRFTELPGIPPRDDPELAALMEAVRRLPRDRADTTIESTLRCALGYRRTGNPEFLTRLASSVLITFRVRRNPEDQAVLDSAGTAPHTAPVPAAQPKRKGRGAQ